MQPETSYTTTLLLRDPLDVEPVVNTSSTTSRPHVPHEPVTSTLERQPSAASDYRAHHVCVSHSDRVCVLRVTGRSVSVNPGSLSGNTLRPKHVVAPMDSNSSIIPTLSPARWSGLATSKTRQISPHQFRRHQHSREHNQLALVRSSHCTAPPDIARVDRLSPDPCDRTMKHSVGHNRRHPARHKSTPGVSRQSRSTHSSAISPSHQSDGHHPRGDRRVRVNKRLHTFNT